MRVWLDPGRLASRNIATSDVVQALREQNVQVASGAVGQQPVPTGHAFQLPVTTLGRLREPEEFENIVVRTGADERIPRVRDVARSELGARDYSVNSYLDNQPAGAMAIAQLPGSNALATADAVERTMEELSRGFPEGLAYRIVYNPTVFVRESINEVIHTLFAAVGLVVIVVLVFLQTWRASLIPLLAIPVSLVGTLAAMKAFGFSLNMLSLFGLVLAIGIVVDDAIVVVENVERHIAAGLGPREAAHRAMDEVTGAVIAIAFGLSAVFVPTAFLGGITGQFYRQFALTIAVATILSAFNSLTLSPAMCALLLQPEGAEKDWFGRLWDRLLGGFFRVFNRVFERTSHRYGGSVARLVRRPALALTTYALLLGLIVVGFRIIPTGFIPVQDLGTSGGFKLLVQDRAGQGFPALQEAADAYVGAARADPDVARVFTTFRASAPQLYADIDRVKAEKLGVPLANVFDTLQVYLGSVYVNDFNRFGRTFQVRAQAEGAYRAEPEDVVRIKTRNNSNGMVPLGSVVNLQWRSGSDRIVRYNMFPAAEVNGDAAPGGSQGTALAAMERLAAQVLPPGMQVEWTDIAYQAKLAGNTAVFIFPLCVLFVFLVHSAEYESWSLALAIILIAPMCLPFALFGTWLRGLDNNLITQIGFITLIGLAAKNAVLIVEFAKQQQEEGKDRFAAAVEASRLRLRPILMTSFAFILGVLPLARATGPGAEMRQALGTAVFSGMLGVTFFGLFLTPVFYVVLRRSAAARAVALERAVEHEAPRLPPPTGEELGRE